MQVMCMVRIDRGFICKKLVWFIPVSAATKRYLLMHDYKSFNWK